MLKIRKIRCPLTIAPINLAIPKDSTILSVSVLWHEDSMNEEIVIWYSCPDPSAETNVRRFEWFHAETNVLPENARHVATIQTFCYMVYHLFEI